MTRRRVLSAATGAAAVLAAVVLLQVGPATAQEGHPLKGSWLGTWEGNETHGDSVLVILDWDGENLTGIINPGTDDIPIREATLDPEGWQVHIEADAKDGSGATIHYVIDGAIENLELPNRSIVGTWESEQGSGAFEVSRQ